MTDLLCCGYPATGHACEVALALALGGLAQLIMPSALDRLRLHYAVEAARFDQYPGDVDFLAGRVPGIAGCAIHGYGQWLPEAGVTPTSAMARWIARMRAWPVMRRPDDFFPTT